MAKTYDPSALATDETYQVRFLVGDTQAPPYVTPATAALDDQEIDWLITQEANVYMAAAAAADQIAYAIMAADGTAGFVTRKRVGQTDISYANGRTAGEYQALAQRLRARSNHKMPFAGGISVADVETRMEDTDRPQDRLRLNQFDSPIAGTPSDTDPRFSG